MRQLTLSACVLALSGCATLSFAPPQVRHDREIYASNEQTFFNAVCTPNHADTNPRIRQNVKGALALVENYILTYGCQADRASEGRQFFEVPGFLIAAGAATAAAFGAGPDVAIGAGAAALGLKSGHEYYAPKDKAAVFRAAVDALNCIKREASGIDTATLRAINEAQGGDSGNGGSNGGNGQAGGSGANLAGAGVNTESDQQAVNVSIPSELMYFNAVESAIEDVVNTVRGRLANVGKPFDGAGVVAQIKQLSLDAKKTEDAAGTPADAGEQLKKTVVPVTAVETSTQGVKTYHATAATTAQRKLLNMNDSQVGQVAIDVRALSPKLAVCAVQAKV